MQAQIDLSNIKGLEYTITPLDDNLTEVDMRLAGAHVTFCSNKTEQECVNAAFQMLMNSLLELNYMICNDCTRVKLKGDVYDSDRDYTYFNRLIRKGFLG